MSSQEPSATALLIAKATVLLSLEPRYQALVPPEAAKWCERFVAGASASGPRFLRQVRYPLYRKLLWTVERCTLPGILIHYWVCKRFIEEVVRLALDEGYHRVVILGAGFDTLALRLAHSFPGTSWVELDHPNTQRVKTAVLHRFDDHGRVSFVPVDLSSRTFAEGWDGWNGDGRTSTLFIAEAVLIYLAPPAVDRVLSLLRSCTAPQIRMVLTFLEPRPDGRLDFHNPSRAVNLWMRMRGERFTFGVPMADLAGYLSERGFTLRALSSVEKFRSCYLAPYGLHKEPLIQGEHVCIAERTP